MFGFGFVNAGLRRFAFDTQSTDNIAGKVHDNVILPISPVIVTIHCKNRVFRVLSHTVIGSDGADSGLRSSYSMQSSDGLITRARV